jgi:hypothetical protein
MERGEGYKEARSGGPQEISTYLMWWITPSHNLYGIHEIVWRYSFENCDSEHPLLACISRELKEHKKTRS